MIVRYSAFSDNEFGNGAEKRSAQLTQILENAGKKLLSINKSPQRSRANYFERLRLGLKYTRMMGVGLHDFKELQQIGTKLHWWITWLKELKATENEVCVVWEMSRYSDNTLPYACCIADIPIFAVPHNLESLVHNQPSFLSQRMSPSWFDEELKLLSLCDAVFTISREEQWLLNLYGVKSFYLPYFPSEKTIGECLEVKSAREHSQKKYFLALGTALNPPTYEGFAQLIQYYKSNAEIELGELVIAGYGTERLIDNFPELDERITIMGPLSTEELKSVLIEAKAVIINQAAATGALTKIPELLACGIPILGNEGALRTYYNIEGLYPFTSLNDLKRLQQCELIVPEFPDKHDDYVQHFRTLINEVLS